MGAMEQLRALAKDDLEVWYPTSFERESSSPEDVDMYSILSGADPLYIQRLGTCEYKIELVTEDEVFVFYRHLDEV